MIDKISPKKYVTDRDERLLKPGDMIEAQNVTIVERGDGSDFVIKTMVGQASANPATSDHAVIGDVDVIGQVSDDQRGFLYIFVKGVSDSNLDAIYQHDESTNLYKEVLRTSRLNFRSGSVNFVKGDVLNKSFQRDGVIESVLYFTDNVNPPRKINVDRALDGGYNNFLYSDDDFDIATGAMRSASVKPPTVSFDTDTNTTENNFEQNSMQFATQIVYKDGEVSTLSPYSKLAISQAAVFGGVEDASFGVARSTQNVCVINHKIDTDFPDMAKVRIVARSGNTGSFFIVDEFDPNTDITRNINGSSTTIYDASNQEYRFYNDSVGLLISATESEKLFDNVPQKAKAQSITSSRLMYGNYEEGYENHTIDSSAVMSVVYGSVPGGTQTYLASGDTSAIFETDPIDDMNINIDLENGSLIDGSITFDAGTQFRASFTYSPSFVATAASGNLIEFSGVSLSDPPTSHNFATNSIDFTALTLDSSPFVEVATVLPNDMDTDELADHVQGLIESTGEVKCRFQADGLAIPQVGGGLSATVDTGFIDVFFAFGEDATATADIIEFKPRITNIKFVDVTWDDFGSVSLFPDTVDIFAQDGDSQDEITYTSVADPSYSDEFLFIETLGSTPTFKSGANHEFGIVYHDKYGRTGFVNELGSIYVESLPEREAGERGNASIKFNLSSTNFTAPTWATGYQIVYGGSSVQDSFQYTVGGGFARRLKTSTNNVYDIDESVHNIYVSLETLSQYQRDKRSTRDYSFTKGDKLRIIAKRNSSDSDWVYLTSSQSKLMEFDVVGYETLDETPIKIQTTDIAEDENNPYKGKFLVLTAPAVEGTTGETTIGDINEYDGFDWHHVAGKIYNGTVNVPAAIDNRWNQGVLVEIITPKKPTSQKVYYEVGERKPLLPVGRIDASIGTHGPAFTINSGDVRFRAVACKMPKHISGSWPIAANTDPEKWIYRTTMIEDPSISDLYESKEWDRGRAHTVFKDAATVRRENSIVYSDPYVEDSARLALSQFTPALANFFDLPSEHGPCSYLCNMSDYLMSIQEQKVSRLAVNKQLLSSAEGGGIVGLSSSVLNLINKFDESFGTSNPESVLIHDGVGYFFDAIRYKLIKFNASSISPISDKDIKNSFETTVISWLKGSNPRVVSGYDPVDDVYYVSFEAVPTHLPDGRTLGYNNKIKAWQGEYTFVPQHYGTVRNSFYLLDEVGTNRKLVHVYGDNENSNLFYDSSTRATSKVTVVSNAKPSAVKAYESISLEGESEWTVTLESSTGQTTEELSFSEREGTFYANVTGDNSSNSFRHLIPVGKVASTDGSTITMQNSLKGIHIPNGYTIFKTSTGGVKPVTTGETVGGVDRSAKTITASGGGHGLSNSDVLYVAGNQAVNGDQIRGHYCKIKCSKTPAPVDTARHELYAINAKVTESKNHHG